MIRRFKIYDLGLMIFLILFALFINHKSPFVNRVYATESTPSSTLSPDLKIKLDDLKKEIASKAARLKQEMNRKLLNKAYVGIIKTKTETTLTLASKTGAKIVTINEDTVFESKIKSKQKLSLKTLNEEDYIAALGDVDETQVLIAKKITLLPAPKETKTYFWGQIISASNKLITVLERNQKNIAVSFSDASVKKGDDTVTSDDLSLRDFVITTGVLDESGILHAEFIYIIPQGGIIKPKTATPSGKKR